MSVAANRYARALMDVLYPDYAEIGLDQLERFASLLRPGRVVDDLARAPLFKTTGPAVRVYATAAGASMPAQRFIVDSSSRPQALR